MILAVANGKYGQRVSDFLQAHLPTVADGSGTVDYEIEDVDALVNAGTLYISERKDNIIRENLALSVQKIFVSPFTIARLAPTTA